MTGLRVFFVLGLAMTAACDGYTSPTCDPLGRGPVPILEFTCAAAGQDVQCQALRRDYGYCRRPDLDVTASASWISSAPTVGVFKTPGYLTALGAGQVEISVKFEFLSSTPSAAVFTVTPGNTAERMLELTVIVTDTDSRRLADVSLKILPQRGVPQTCNTDALGLCHFWVFETSIEVIGTKPGYQPAQATAVIRTPVTMRSTLTMQRE